MKKAPIKILIGALLLLALIALGLKVQHSRTRSALEQYKAELRAKGQKLTFAELGPSHSTNGTANTRKFMSATADLRGVGSPVLDIAAMSYVAPGTARVAWTEPKAHLFSTKDDEAITWAELEEQVDAAIEAVTQMREALKEPDLDLGWDQKDVFNRPKDDFVMKRTAAKWLAGAVVTELHRGRLGEALEHMHSLIAMTQMQREELTLVNQMIRVAIGGLGLAVTWEALQTNGWSDAQLKRMQTDWESVNLLEALEKGFLGERALFVDSMDSMRASRNQNAGQMGGGAGLTDQVMSLGLSWVWNPEGDELFYLQNMQVILDSVRALTAHRSWDGVKAGMDNNKAKLDKIGRSIFKYRYLLSLIAIPNTTRGVETALRIETQRQLTLAAIAIKRNQLRHGKLPESLTALVPDYLSALPHDYMSGKPLCYRLNAGRGFVLYSVGEDGKDEGGDPHPFLSTNRFGLWEGRDAVWPIPADK